MNFSINSSNLIILILSIISFNFFLSCNPIPEDAKPTNQECIYIISNYNETNEVAEYLSNELNFFIQYGIASIRDSLAIINGYRRISNISNDTSNTLGKFEKIDKGYRNQICLIEQQLNNSSLSKEKENYYIDLKNARYDYFTFLKNLCKHEMDMESDEMKSLSPTCSELNSKIDLLIRYDLIERKLKINKFLKKNEEKLTPREFNTELDKLEKINNVIHSLIVIKYMDLPFNCEKPIEKELMRKKYSEIDYLKNSLK